VKRSEEKRSKKREEKRSERREEKRILRFLSLTMVPQHIDFTVTKFLSLTLGRDLCPGKDHAQWS
jgi:hypothetical protein